MSAKSCHKGKKNCTVSGALFYGLCTAAGAFLFMFALNDFQVFAKDLEKSKIDALAVLSSQSDMTVLPSTVGTEEDISPRTVTFRLPFWACPEGAEKDGIFLKADFNLWGAREIALEKTEEGYAKTLFLPKGEYKYYFSAGSLEIKDPQCDGKIELEGKEVSLKKVS